MCHVLTLLLLASAVASAVAAPTLKYEFKADTNQLQLTVNNDGAAMTVLAEGTPCLSNILTNAKYLVVKDAQGQRVPYQGVMLKSKGTPVQIPTGPSTFTCDVGKSFPLKSGQQYTLECPQCSLHSTASPQPLLATATFTPVTPTRVEQTMLAAATGLANGNAGGPRIASAGSGRSIPGVPTATPQAALQPTDEPALLESTEGVVSRVGDTTVTWTSCSGKCKTDTELAFKNAKVMLTKSMAYMRCYDQKEAHFKKWFGKDATASQFSYVKEGVSKTVDRLNGAFAVDGSETGCNDNWYAYVLGGDPKHTIHLCPLYTGSADTGTDSKAGTIIHEILHFESVRDTGDHFYGQDDCLTAAASNTATTIKNSDSYEYFHETTPPACKASSHATTIPMPNGKGVYIKIKSCTMDAVKQQDRPYWHCTNGGISRDTNVGKKTGTGYAWDPNPSEAKTGFGIFYRGSSSKCTTCYLKDAVWMWPDSSFKSHKFEICHDSTNFDEVSVKGGGTCQVLYNIEPKIGDFPLPTGNTRVV